MILHLFSVNTQNIRVKKITFSRDECNQRLVWSLLGRALGDPSRVPGICHLAKALEATPRGGLPPPQAAAHALEQGSTASLALRMMEKSICQNPAQT
jgi:hypothetical protein